MNRSTCWTALATSLAVISALMGLDISSNVFVAAVIIIQAVKPADEPVLNQSAMAVCVIFATAIFGFAMCAWVFGLEWSRPLSW